MSGLVKIIILVTAVLPRENTGNDEHGKESNYQVSDSLGQELQVVVSHPEWVLRSKVVHSGIGTSPPSCLSWPNGYSCAILYCTDI